MRSHSPIELQLVTSDFDVLLLHPPLVHSETVDRHCIEHLIGNNQPTESLRREAIKPENTIHHSWQTLLQQHFLTRLKIRTHIDDKITIRQTAQRLQLIQQVRRQYA